MRRSGGVHMRITDIVQSKYHMDSFLIFLESGEKIRTFKSVIAEFDIKIGKEFTYEEIEYLRIASNTDTAEALAAKIASLRPISKSELKRRLTDEGIPEEIAEATVIRFDSQNIISDLKFAILLVQHYSNRGCGIDKIEDELLQRNIDLELWGEAFKHYAPPGKTIERIMERKLNGKILDTHERTKMKDFLLSRGFNIEDINAGLDRYLVGRDHA